MGAAWDAAEDFTSALEEQDWEYVKSHLARGFEFNDPGSPNPPMNAEQWLAASMGVARAFSDFTYHFEILEEDGDQVWVRARMEGTHDGDWDLTAMGLGVIPATGRHVSSGVGVTVGSINADGNLEYVEVVEGDENTGFGGLLRGLGVDLG